MNEMYDKIVQEKEQYLRMQCLDKAISVSSPNRYAASSDVIKASTAEEIVETAKKFYDYIEGK